MARGVFSGLIWGTVVAGLGAGGLSLAYPEFAPGAPQMSEQMADTSEPESSGDMASEAAKPEETSTAEMAPQQAAPETETQTGAMSMDQPKEDQPEAEDSRVLDEDAPVLPSETDMAADAPDTPIGAEMSEVEPVAEDMTDIADIEADPAEATPDSAPESDDLPAGPAPSEPLQAEIAQTEPLEPELEQPAPEQSSDPVQTADEARPQDVTEEAVEAQQTEPSQPATSELVGSEDPAISITEDIIAALPETRSGTGTIGNLAPNVTTGRLPSVGTEDTPADDTTPGDAPQSPETDATPDATPPLVAFAESFDPPGDRPLMSIVLIDDGQTRLGPEALETFPYPLTFAVDAAAENAAERMALYRGNGFEVMALAGLPQGATPSDVEVAMTAYLAAVPEAVAVLEAPDVSLQTNRAVSDQVTQIIQASGHGLVLQANGLNTAQKLAAREGVSSAAVFRDFDGKGQGATVIRRFLDQAAFRARQEGGVVMLGRLQPETISALLIWGLADRASRVALVPVSGVLTALNAGAAQ